MNQRNMREKSIMSLLVSMGVPMTISMIANSLYNIVDSIFVSMISQNAMTALSLLFPLQNVMFSVAVGFGVGINAVCARQLGAGNGVLADETASAGIWLSILHGAIVTAVCLLVSRPFLLLYRPGAEILRDGMAYARVVFLFSIIVNLQITWQKIFQAAGWMTSSMTAMLIGAGCNILLDPLMIFGIGVFPRMGISGAGLATGISQTISLIFYLLLYKRGGFPIHVHLRKAHFPGAQVKGMYAVGAAATMNMLLPSFLITCLNAILAPFSAVYVFVLGIYYKLQNFLYMASNGLVQGMRPLMAYNYGAREKQRVWTIYKDALKMTLWIMAAGTILCLCIPRQLTALFSAGPEALRIGTGALRIICIGFLPSAVSVVASGCLEALGRGIESFVISFLRYTAVILPCAAVLSRIIGPSGVWHAFWIAEAVTAAVSWILFRRVYQNLSWGGKGADGGVQSSAE